MESILNLIVNAENVRMLVILAFGFSGFVLMRSQMKEMSHSFNKRIDELKYNDLTAISRRVDDLKNNDLAAISRRIDDLKNNDFAHLTSTIEALTYALEKNCSLKKEDKEYVDSRLAH